MQSIRKKYTAPLVAVFLFLTNLEAAIIRVPIDQTTIQAALDAIIVGDTILVSNGNYAEELTAPNFGFALIGDVVPDTGLYQRPVVDPSTLTSPTTRTCLRHLHGEVVVERMWFKNGAAMHPHQHDLAGGIKNETAKLVISDCVFDSTYRGVVSFDSSVTLERCIFRATIRNCVYMANATLRAYDCDFESIDSEWSSIIGGNGTIVERCQLHGSAGLNDWWFTVGGGTWLVRDNVFGPGGGSRTDLFRIGGTDGVFEDNLITGCIARGVLMGVYPQCQGMIQIRNNKFVDNHMEEDEFTGNLCLGVGAQYDSLTMCSEVLVTGNEFIGNVGGSVVKGINTQGHDVITRNTFRGLLPDSQWTVLASYNDPLIRDNMFFDNGKAVRPQPGYAVNAEFNWWGHASGPFHADSNSLGEGDEVGDNVDFDPWYTDTLFFTASPEPRPPLPERATLMAYPNPFNATTTLHLTVAHAGIVRIEIFDITGRRVKELWSGPVGDNKDVVWQAGDFASGLYFARAWDPLGNRPLAMTKIVLLK